MKRLFLFLLGACFLLKGQAHPMPNSIVLLDVKSNSLHMELQLPMSELQLALQANLPGDAAILLQTKEQELKNYILAHIKPVSQNGQAWQVVITGMKLGASEQTATGPYQELIVQLLLYPPAGTDPRNFTLHYDVIIHQVVTHKAMVSVRQDWETGKHGESTTEVGVIELDIPSNIIRPLIVHQEPGSWWQGFSSMVHLGIQHIGEGTDHLLFLLVLLLPAPLLVSGKKWGSSGGTRYSLLRLLKIITAFTIGHSLTLLVGTLGWVRLPAQPVEVLIAFSILVSAIHAIRPIFPGKEVYVAAGFGLVHGLAFAGILYNLNLEAGRLALSILGFNIGIELMQLFVILITVPWLILLSKTPTYTIIRITGALLAGIASIVWITERVAGINSIAGAYIQSAADKAYWLVAGLGLLSVCYTVFDTE